MSKTRVILPVAMMLLAAAAVVWGQDRFSSLDRVTDYGPTRIVTELSGDQVVGSVATRDIAKARFDIRSDCTVHYKIDTTGVRGLTGVYVHQGKAGQVGPIIAALYVPPDPTGLIRGTVVEGTLTSENLRGDFAGKSVNDLVGQMMNNNAYVTITTLDHPDGELRGNIPYPYN